MIASARRHTLPLLLLILLLFSAGCSEDVKSPYTMLAAIKEQYSQTLGKVSLFDSEAEEGTDAHLDTELVGVMLSDDDSYPAEMAGAEQYAFLCSSELSVCEVWVVKCYTNTSARDVYALFEKRGEMLSGREYDSQDDEASVKGMALKREGRYVFFAVAPNGADIVRTLCEK